LPLLPALIVQNILQPLSARNIITLRPRTGPNYVSHTHGLIK